MNNEEYDLIVGRASDILSDRIEEIEAKYSSLFNDMIKDISIEITNLEFNDDMIFNKSI